MFKYFFWTTLVLLLCGGIFGFTLINLGPQGNMATLAISVFYVSLFGFIWSLMTYLFFFGTELSMGRNLKDYNFRVAIRRGLWVALFVIGALAMKMFNVLGWAEVLLFALFLTILELIFSENRVLTS